MGVIVYEHLLFELITTMCNMTYVIISYLDQIDHSSGNAVPIQLYIYSRILVHELGF